MTRRHLLRRSLIAAFAVMGIAAPSVSQANSQTIYVPIQIKNFSGFTLNDFKFAIYDGNNSYKYGFVSNVPINGYTNMPFYNNMYYRLTKSNSNNLYYFPVELSGGSDQVTVSLSGHYIGSNGQLVPFDTGEVPYELYAVDNNVFLTLTLNSYGFRPRRVIRPNGWAEWQYFSFNIYSNMTSSTGLTLAQ